MGSEWPRNNEGCSLGLWISDLDLVCIGWVLTGIEVGAGTDLLWDLAFDDWGWTKVEAYKGWLETEEKPGGIEGEKGEWEEDNWEGWDVETIEEAGCLESRLK